MVWVVLYDEKSEEKARNKTKSGQEKAKSRSPVSVEPRLPEHTREERARRWISCLDFFELTDWKLDGNQVCKQWCDLNFEVNNSCIYWLTAA